MFINPSDWSIKFYWRTLIRDARDDRTRSASTGYARNTSSRSDFRRANISTWLRARALHVRGACSTSDSSPKYSPSPNINVPFRWGQPEISTKPPLMKYISFPISPPRKIGSWAWCWCSCAFMKIGEIFFRFCPERIITRIEITHNSLLKLDHGRNFNGVKIVFQEYQLHSSQIMSKFNFMGPGPTFVRFSSISALFSSWYVIILDPRAS